MWLLFDKEEIRMKRKVLFFLESLGGGGAEKVLSTLVKHLNKQAFDITVCIIVSGGKYDNEVASQVQLYSLLSPPKEHDRWGKIWYWCRYQMIYKWLPPRWIYKWFLPYGSDVEIAFVEGFATRVLSYSTNKRAKKIAWVHSDFRQGSWPIQIGVFKNFEEEQLAYSRFDKVICVSHSVESSMREIYGLNPVCTIYNPLDEEDICEKAKQDYNWTIDKQLFNIVSIGRLEYQKGYDLLLPVIKRLRDDGIFIHFWLIGEGRQYGELEKQARELGIIEVVTFTGFLRNPYALLSNMDLLICSSRAEGFSLVIAEALVLNVPVLSMNCGGPNELLANDMSRLCNSYEELYEKTKAEINSSKGKNKVSKPGFLQIDNIMSQIEELLVE